MLKYDDFLLFPFFVNISMYCVRPGKEEWRKHEKLLPNHNNPIRMPMVARHGQSLIIFDDLEKCSRKCSLVTWPNFVHFGMDSNGEICPGVDFYKCECASMQCIGDTVILGDPKGRSGTLWIPYSTPGRPTKDVNLSRPKRQATSAAAVTAKATLFTTTETDWMALAMQAHNYTSPGATSKRPRSTPKPNTGRSTKSTLFTTTETDFLALAMQMHNYTPPTRRPRTTVPTAVPLISSTTTADITTVSTPATAPPAASIVTTTAASTSPILTTATALTDITTAIPPTVVASTATSTSITALTSIPTTAPTILTVTTSAAEVTQKSTTSPAASTAKTSAVPTAVSTSATTVSSSTILRTSAITSAPASTSEPGSVPTTSQPVGQSSSSSPATSAETTTPVTNPVTSTPTTAASFTTILTTTSPGSGHSAASPPTTASGTSSRVTDNSDSTGIVQTTQVTSSNTSDSDPLRDLDISNGSESTVIPPENSTPNTGETTSADADFDSLNAEDEVLDINSTPAAEVDHLEGGDAENNSTGLPGRENGTTTSSKPDKKASQIYDPRQGHDIDDNDPESQFKFHRQWKWLDFCRDDFAEAGTRVVCNQLQLRHHHYSNFDIQNAGLPRLEKDEDITYLQYVTNCTGNEKKLSECTFTKRSQVRANCSGPVVMYCSDGTNTRFDSHSITGSTALADTELLVFMSHIGKWSTVCRKNWTAFDNTLACEWAGKLDPFANAQAQSCWEHRFNYMLHERKANSGLYYIYSTKWQRVIPVFCDMAHDGGGWTMVLAANMTVFDEKWTAAGVLNRNPYTPVKQANYSILEIADSLQIVDSKATVQERNPEYLVHLHYNNKQPKSVLQVRYPMFCTLSGTGPCNTSADIAEDGYQMSNAEIINNVSFFLESDPEKMTVPWLIFKDDGFVYTLSDYKNGSKVLGVLLASSYDDQWINSSKPAFRMDFFVRTRNYRIKDPPETDCKVMDYLLDGNARVQNAQFSTSSVRDDIPGLENDGFLSFLSTTDGKSNSTDTGGWVSEKTASIDGSTWIGVDLLTPHKIQKILLRGVDHSRSRLEGSWVTEFSLQKITLGEELQGEAESVQLLLNKDRTSIFPGNNDTHTVAEIRLPRSKEYDNIRVLRLVPTNASLSAPPVGLRWELIGCSRVPRSEDAFILEAMTNEALGITSSRRNYRLGAPAKYIWYSPACSSENFEIRLPEAYLLKSIIVSGHPNHRDVIKKFKLLFSRTGSSHHYKWYGANMDEVETLETDQPRIFLGPQDGASPHYINFRYPWTARLLRFVILEPRGKPCYVRLELVGRPLTDACTMPLGMNSGNISDFQLTSSSQFAPPCPDQQAKCRYSYGPERARYSTGTSRNDARGAGAWRPAPEDEKPWIAVDLLALTQITAVIVQASEFSYMSTFDIEFSYGAEWHMKKPPRWKVDDNNRIGSFRLPSFLIYLTPPVYARHIKIKPLQFTSFGAHPVNRNVKFELLGCLVTPHFHPERPQFTKHFNVVLHPDPHFDSYWDGVNDTECADKCLQEKGFSCQGYYISDTRCTLTAGNFRSWDVTGFVPNQPGIVFNQREETCTANLGLTNRKVISDFAFTASSNKKRASSARLLFRADGLYEKGWIAAADDENPYIQVSLPGTYLITGFHVNGDGKENHVKELNIQFFNGIEWKFCYDPRDKSKPMVFDGNRNHTHASTTWIPSQFQPRASKIRLYPVSYALKRPAAFQFELTGCQIQRTDLTYPMGFSQLKCTGNEQIITKCPHTVSNPNDQHCNFNTSVRPQCVPHCGDPGHRACATRSGIHFFAPHQVTYECHDGTKQIIQCKDTGFWTTSGRSCVREAVENVAKYKTAYQSSTSIVPSHQHASNAVDGDDQRNMRTCTFTNEEISPWWYVDLKHTYEIQSLNVTLGFATHVAEIRIGQQNPVNESGTLDFTVNTLCFSADYPLPVANDGTNTASIECKSGNPISDQEFGNSPVFGRFVSIQVPSMIPTVLSLCEVKVLGMPCMTNDVQDQAEFADMFTSKEQKSGLISTDAQAVQEVQTEGKEEESSPDSKEDNVGCSHSHSGHRLQDQPFVMYSPGGQVYVTGLTIETDKKPYELHNYEVRVGEYPSKQDFAKNGLCFRKKGVVPAGQTEVIKCDPPLYGSYIIIVVTDVNKSYLSLCKVKIWGKLCDARLDGVDMRPLTSSTTGPGSDIWVLINDDVACFETGIELSPWVMLDMAFPTEIKVANFTLCDHVASGQLELRVGDDKLPMNNGIMASNVKVTSLQSQTSYSVRSKASPALAGRYFSVHLMATGKVQSLCICNLTMTRDHYCPTDHYHNVAYNMFPRVSSRDPNQNRPEVTTDGYHEHLHHLCFSTKIENRPYWVIKLPRPRKIFTVRLLAKQDSNKQVRVGMSDRWRDNAVCRVIDNHSTGIKAHTISCVDDNTGQPAYGSVISIEVVDGLAAKLVICEVEVWGY